MTTETRDRLVEALAVLQDGRNWTKLMTACTRYTASDQSRPGSLPALRAEIDRCLLGAVANKTSNFFGWTASDSNRYAAEIDLLARVIHEQFPDREPIQSKYFSPETRVAFFNDHHDTSFDDVRMVLEKAILLTGDVTE